MGKGFCKLAALLAAVFWLTVFGALGNYREVSAATKKQTAIQVKVDSKYKASLVKKTDGWYLQSSRISMSTRKAAERVAYLTIPKKKELTSGYYYFNKKGRLDTRRAFHQLNTTVNGRKFSGKYYFGELNGRLRMKAGWVTYKGNQYALNKYGKCIQAAGTEGVISRQTGKSQKA